MRALSPSSASEACTVNIASIARVLVDALPTNTSSEISGLLSFTSRMEMCITAESPVVLAISADTFMNRNGLVKLSRSIFRTTAAVQLATLNSK